MKCFLLRKKTRKKHDLKKRINEEMLHRLSIFFLFFQLGTYFSFAIKRNFRKRKCAPSEATIFTERRTTAQQILLS